MASCHATGGDVDSADQRQDGFTIEHDHPSLEGHFPGHPVVPGVLVLDRVLAIAEDWTGQPVGAIGLPQVKFVQPLLPGQRADVVLQRPNAGDVSRIRFEVSHAGALVARGEFGAIA